MTSFVWTDELRAELSQFFHMSAAYVDLKGTEQMNRYNRRLWASARFSKEHPECSSTGAYKELCRSDAWREMADSMEPRVVDVYMTIVTDNVKRSVTHKLFRNRK